MLVKSGKYLVHFVFQKLDVYFVSKMRVGYFMGEDLCDGFFFVFRYFDGKYCLYFLYHLHYRRDNNLYGTSWNKLNADFFTVLRTRDFSYLTTQRNIIKNKNSETSTEFIIMYDIFSVISNHFVIWIFAYWLELNASSKDSNCITVLQVFIATHYSLQIKCLLSNTFTICFFFKSFKWL